MERHELDTPENFYSAKLWFINSKYPGSWAPGSPGDAAWDALEPIAQLACIRDWMIAGSPPPFFWEDLESVKSMDFSVSIIERAKALFMFHGMWSEHIEDREKEWTELSHDRRKAWFWAVNHIENEENFQKFQVERALQQKAKESLFPLYLAPDAYGLSLRFDPEKELTGEERCVMIPLHTKEVVVSLPSSNTQSYDESHKVLAKKGIDFKVKRKDEFLDLFPMCLVENPLKFGIMEPVSGVLRQLAAQENCDGEPYDQMVLAAEHIDALEAELKSIQKEEETLEETLSKVEFTSKHIVHKVDPPVELSEGEASPPTLSDIREQFSKLERMMHQYCEVHSEAAVSVKGKSIPAEYEGVFHHTKEGWFCSEDHSLTIDFSSSFVEHKEESNG